MASKNTNAGGQESMLAGLGGVRKHHLVRAKQRLQWLRRFWSAERAAGYQGRWGVAQDVVDAVKAELPNAAISVKSMQRWENRWYSDGLSGLLDKSGRPPIKPKGRCKVIKYGADGTVEPSELYLQIKAAHQRLLAVADKLPDGEDDASLAGHVVDDVTEFLGVLVQELDEWTKTRWPQVGIVPGLYTQLMHFCRRFEVAGGPEFKGFDAQDFARAIINSGLQAQLRNTDLDVGQELIYFRQIIEESKADGSKIIPEPERVKETG